MSFSMIDWSVMPRKVLHVASEGDTPRTLTVSQAAAGGSTRELLVAMRARIATAVEDSDTPARDLAALTKRLVEVVRDIEAIDARDAEQPVRRKAVAATFDASAV